MWLPVVVADLMALLTGVVVEGEEDQTVFKRSCYGDGILLLVDTNYQ